MGSANKKVRGKPVIMRLFAAKKDGKWYMTIFTNEADPLVPYYCNFPKCDSTCYALTSDTYGKDNCNRYYTREIEKKLEELNALQGAVNKYVQGIKTLASKSRVFGQPV